jgi:hypothetical protein
LPVSDDVVLPGVSRVHLQELSDSIGIFQHAVMSAPDPAHGYCTDDVSRSLQVDLLHARVLGWPAVEHSAGRNLRFLADAYDPVVGRFRNFRRVDRTWLGGTGSEDCQGRAMHALGDATGAPDEAFARQAASLFHRALPAMRGLRALRAVASLTLACDAAVRAGVRGASIAAYATFASRLAHRFTRPSGSPEWPWPEPVVTYENGLPVRALIVAGAHHADPTMIDAGVRTLDWLVAAQTGPGGHCSPVGNGWWPRGGTPAHFDQQPIEPVSLLLAAESALATTGHVRHARTMDWAYAWFLGANDLGVPIADLVRGASRDGLTPRGPNGNEGAESTLVWLSAVEHMRAVRAPTPVRPGSSRSALAGRHLMGSPS